MQAIEAGEKCMRVRLDVVMIEWKDTTEEFVFIVVYSFDDETVVAREVKERARFSGTTEL